MPDNTQKEPRFAKSATATNKWGDRSRWIRLGTPVLAAIILGGLIGAGFAATIQVPDLEAVLDYRPSLVTRLVSRGGQVTKEYFKQNRVLIPEGEVPEVLQNALLASEDRNFFRHGGVDPVGVIRAALQNFLSGERGQGASTITMQLAGTILLDRSDRSWKRKIAEAFRAVDLEKQLSKQQILTRYCNEINLGHGNYGFEAAARYYFGKTVADLSVAETATLVAIIKRPSERTPIRQPEVVKRYRNLIVDAMFQDGFIDETTRTVSMAEPVEVVAQEREVPVGAYFSEEVRRALYERYGEDRLYDGGLEVATTLDLAAQAAAERAVRDGLFALERGKGWKGPTGEVEDVDKASLASWSNQPVSLGDWLEGVITTQDQQGAVVRVRHLRFELDQKGVAWTGKRLATILPPKSTAWFRVEELYEASEENVNEAGEPNPLAGKLSLVQEPEIEAALVLLDSATGAVRAMVGGWSFRRNEFNRATQAQRQVGSAFKPFIFGAAYESSYTPADTLFDAPVAFAGADGTPTYSPRNFYREYMGIITLRKILEKSINVSSVKLLDLVGVERVIDFARRTGVTSDLPPYPSLALGSAEMSPLELAQAYASIANHGVSVEPYLIESIRNAEGRVIHTHQPIVGKAMEPDISFMLTHTMRGVVERGTGASLRSLGLEIAGKTGTTDGYTDAWFAGFTPTDTLIVWVGYDLKKSLGRSMTGARAALPIWKQFAAQGIEEGWLETGTEFLAPPGIVFKTVEHNTGLLATIDVAAPVTEAFKAGTEPVEEYTRQWERIMELPWYQQRAFYGQPKGGENMPEDVSDWSLVTWVREAASGN